jgi:hypothetical protein
MNISKYKDFICKVSPVSLPGKGRLILAKKYFPQNDAGVLLLC